MEVADLQRHLDRTPGLNKRSCCSTRPWPACRNRRDSIDECKAWSDKAAALASYARKAKDDELEANRTRHAKGVTAGIKPALSSPP